jgi:hypothetical protein
VLPNDPLVRDLRPVQIDWINFHLKREADVINGGKGGEGFRLETASDIPGKLFNEDGNAKGRSSSDYLGKR